MKLIALITAAFALSLPPKTVPAERPSRPLPLAEMYHAAALKRQAKARELRHRRRLRAARRRHRLRMRPMQVVRAALSQRGVPYVWGGELAGRGFDCSGLMQWAYRMIGVSIGRTTSVLRYAGRPVSLGALRLGDLIFSNGGEHVGMYVGGGNVVEAPHTGDVVKVVRVSYFGVEFARRLL